MPDSYDLVVIQKYSQMIMSSLSLATSNVGENDQILGQFFVLL